MGTLVDWQRRNDMMADLVAVDLFTCRERDSSTWFVLATGVLSNVRSLLSTWLLVGKAINTADCCRNVIVTVLEDRFAHSVVSSLSSHMKTLVDRERRHDKSFPRSYTRLMVYLNCRISFSTWWQMNIIDLVCFAPLLSSSPFDPHVTNDFFHYFTELFR